MKKFEHLVSFSESEMNELGNDGWEMVAVIKQSDGSIRFYYKR